MGSFFYYLRRVKILLFDAQGNASESFLEERLQSAAVVRDSAAISLSARLPLRLFIRSLLFSILAFYILLVHPVLAVLLSEVVQTIR